MTAQTIYEMVILMSLKWDNFVDAKLPYLLQKGFSVKFWSNSSGDFNELRRCKALFQFTDII